MIDRVAIESKLRERYGHLEAIDNDIFVATEEFKGRPFAIRYFDLRDNLQGAAENLKQMQEQLVAPNFYATERPGDLRWNQYLYFVTSREGASSDNFQSAKIKIESDQDYARKSVVIDDELDAVLRKGQRAQRPSTPTDLAAVWLEMLGSHKMSFVLEEQLTVAAIADRILSGNASGRRRASALPTLLDIEKVASSKHLGSLAITQFREYPTIKEYQFGLVNLITGPNGVGKTSLLEAIEFLYCGRSHRTNEVVSHANVSGTLRGEHTLLQSTTSSSQLRARNLAWYAKADGARSTLEQSFGRYNFLNTDAAVELSSSKEDIGEIEGEIARLMLGAEADQLTSRVTKVCDRLVEISKEKDQGIKDVTKDIDFHTTRIAELTGMPKMSDTNFSTFCTALAECRWKQNPDSKFGTTTIGSELQQAMTDAEMVTNAFDRVSQGKETDLNLLRSNIASNLDDVLAAAGRKATIAGDIAKSNARFERASAKESALKIVQVYVDLDFERQTEELESLQSQSSDIRRRLLACQINELELSNSVARSASVEAELASAKNDVRVGQSNITRLNSEIRLLKNSVDRLTNLRQQVVASVRAVLGHTTDPDSCPVCLTKVGRSELLMRLDALSASPESVELAEALEQVEISTSMAAVRSKDVQLMTRLTSNRVIDANTTLAELLDATKRDESDLVEMETRIQALIQFFSNAESIGGLSRGAMNTACRDAGLPRLPNEAELKAKLEEEARAIDSARNDLETATKNQLSQEDEWLQLMQKLGFSADDDSIDAAEQVASDLEIVAQAIEAENRLKKLTEINSEYRREFIALQQAHGALEQLLMSISKESVADKTITDLRTQTFQLEKARTNLAAESERLNAALKVLNHLTSQESSQKVASELIANSARSIDEIFSAIHSPSEFAVRSSKSKKKFEIIRRRDGEVIRLKSMSTGQRSAFALSLFLSLNQYAQSAPPVLIFDDPVAHIDDLNILSFIDYLRDAVIRQGRQIFFSTADAKVASLFRQKFRFLGPEKFGEFDLRRS